MSKQLLAVIALILCSLVSFARLPELTRGANLIAGPVEEVIIIIPGFDHKKLTFDQKGRLIKYSDFKREETFQWKENGILTNSYGAQYHYFENGDTLKHCSDTTYVTIDIYDPKTKVLTKQNIISPDMIFSTEVKKDAYSTILTVRKNGEFYYYVSRTALSTDHYGNPLVAAITTSEGRGWQAFTFYKYYDRPYTSTNGDGDADDLLYKALYSIYIKQDYSTGNNLLDKAEKAYKLSGTGYGVEDCLGEKIMLFCKQGDPETALSMIKNHNFVNEDKDIMLSTTIADAFKSQKNYAKSDSLNMLALTKILKQHKDYRGGGFFPEEARQLFFKLYDDYMSRGEYAKAVKTTQWQLKEMDSFALNVNDLNYQRAVAYHINASYALNPQFVSLAEKCEKLVEHLNSFPPEILSSHPTLQSELLAGAKYCLVSDKWDVAQKLLKAFMQREIIGKSEIPEFWILGGDFYNNTGAKDNALKFYLQALNESTTRRDSLKSIIAVDKVILKVDHNRNRIKEYYLSLMKYFKSINDAYGQSLDKGYMEYSLANEMAYLKWCGFNTLKDSEIIQLYDSASLIFSDYGNSAMAAATRQKAAMKYESMGQENDAIDYYSSVLSSQTVLPGTEQYFDIHTRRGAANDRLGRHADASKDYSEAIATLRQRIKRTFLFLTERQRVNFIAAQELIFDALSRDTSFTHNELRYNAALLHKNLVLSSASRLRNIVESSGNQLLITDFRRLRDAIGSGNNSDSIEALERSILRRSAAYGSYTSAVDIDMKTVQHFLKPNEYAIEIVPQRLGYTTAYIALVLGQKGVEPVPLFTDKEITQALKEDIYSSKAEFGKKFWENIGMAVPEGSKLYISPDGPFHSIAFEYLSVDGKHRANEVYDISRVSSTREICLGAQKRAIDGGALFGGIDYNLDSEDKLLALEEAGLVRGHVGENLGKDVMPWLFLPGTLGEVRAIDKSLEKAGKHSRLFTSDLALEEAFYSLSGKSPSILHMATHGFYLPQYHGANPLSKTGLVMAGANHFWREGWNLAPEPHDGILTGTEIAGLDLGNTDLVVLSACQSGLGDVSAEGVFGLPRAFKKSGAGSILMSLWPVHDNATRLLMDEFYKSLLSGKTKQQSLLDAQTAVKRAKFTTPSGTRESGSNPKYWAAFVLLD